MIINENTKGIDVTEVFLILSPSVSNVSHALSVHEDIFDGIVHRVVEKGIDIVLIVAYVSIETIEAFTHLEYTCRLCILFPEIFRYFRNSINTNAVKVVLLNEILDPGLQVASDVLISLIEIWEAGKAAILNLPLISPVIDVAIGMIMLGFVEGVYL